VLTVFEKVAKFAPMLEIVRDPKGFVMAAELSRTELTCWAWMLVCTVRLLVVTAFEAVRLRVLILGTVIGAEKRRSYDR
jgi:hypothetical protein